MMETDDHRELAEVYCAIIRQSETRLLRGTARPSSGQFAAREALTGGPGTWNTRDLVGTEYQYLFHREWPELLAVIRILRTAGPVVAWQALWRTPGRLVIYYLGMYTVSVKTEKPLRHPLPGLTKCKTPVSCHR